MENPSLKKTRRQVFALEYILEISGVHKWEHVGFLGLMLTEERCCDLENDVRERTVLGFVNIIGNTRRDLGNDNYRALDVDVMNHSLH